MTSFMIHGRPPGHAYSSNWCSVSAAKLRSKITWTVLRVPRKAQAIAVPLLRARDYTSADEESASYVVRLLPPIQLTDGRPSVTPELPDGVAGPAFGEAH